MLNEIRKIIQQKYYSRHQWHNIFGTSGINAGINSSLKHVTLFEVVKKEEKLSGSHKTKLYAEIFESASWFYTPVIDKIHEWDEYVRSQLSRRAKLDKPLQDKIIQTLLITQGKNIKPEILKALATLNETKGEN